MLDNLKIEYDIERQAIVSAHPDPVIGVIETFNYHQSILKIKEFMTDNGMLFSFSYTTQEKTYKMLQNLDKTKTCQENDVPVKILKSHVYFLTLYIITSITHCSVQFFPQNCKRLILYPFIKIRANLILKVLVPLVSFPFSPKLMKGVCLIKCIVTLIQFSLYINVDSDKVTPLITVFFLS